MSPLPVTWQKNSQNSEWFDFLRLDLDASYFVGKKGVFIIWYANPSQAKVIKIGSGSLNEQLKNLRANPAILEYSNVGTLKVSWVSVNGVLKEDQMVGVEAFLGRIYTPLLGERKNVPEIQVNLLAK